MTENFFPISFTHDNIHYEGRVSPENKQGHITSWHVVLNDVFFGYVSLHDEHWQVSEQRPDGLVKAVGKCIGKL